MQEQRTKKIGRPEKPERDKKKYQAPPVRMTEEEYILFNGLVLQSGLSKNDFIKSAIFNKKITVKQEKTLDFKSLQSLKDLGNNLNQIARKYNATGNINNPLLDDLLILINETLMKALHDIEE